MYDLPFSAFWAHGLQACATMPGWNPGLCECEAHTLPMEPHLFSWGVMGWLSAEFLDSGTCHLLSLSMVLTQAVGWGMGLLLSNAHYILEGPGCSQIMILGRASRKKKTGKQVPKSSLQEYEGLNYRGETRPLAVLGWLRGRPVALWKRRKLCFWAEPGPIKGFSYGNDAQEICQLPCWSTLSTGHCCSVGWRQETAFVGYSQHLKAAHGHSMGFSVMKIKLLYINISPFLKIQKNWQIGPTLWICSDCLQWTCDTLFPFDYKSPQSQWLRTWSSYTSVGQNLIWVSLSQNQGVVDSSPFCSPWELVSSVFPRS